MSNKGNKGEKLSIKVSVIGIIVNFILSVFKIIAGIVANSSAMVSDGAESCADILSTVIVIIGIKISGKKADSMHRYGHERLGSVTALFLALILVFSAVGIAFVSFEKIKVGIKGSLPEPGILALIAAAVSIAVKEWMYWFTRSAAKKTNSDILMANAWHHRSDAFSSIGTLVGIAGAKVGFPILDPITSLVLCILILKIAYDIAVNSLSNLTDKSIDQKVLCEICEVIKRQEGVIRIDDIKTRKFSSSFYVDVEISVDRKLSLEKAHDISETVHDEIEAKFTDAKHVMVHVNPYFEKE